MSGDHLTARQRAGNWLGQASLTDSNVGLLSKTDSAYWSSAIKHYLPRHGAVGSQMVDTTAVIYSNALSNTSNGITIEAVVSTTDSSFNFFGGVWNKNIVRYQDFTASYGIEVAAINDSLSDTTGRARMISSYGGNENIAYRNVFSKPVITDGVPHHVLMTINGFGTIDVANLYVDGVFVETAGFVVPLKSTLSQNSLIVSVDGTYAWAGEDGVFSHACLTNGVLSYEEIQARANLVDGLSDQGNLMAWDGANERWTANIDGYGSSTAYNVKVPNLYLAAQSQDKPQVMLPMQESGGTTITDYSGNGRNATVVGNPTVGAAFTSPIFTKAVDFNGTNTNYVKIDNASWMNAWTKLTVEAIVTPDTYTNARWIVAIDNETSSRQWFLRIETSGFLMGMIQTTSGVYTVTGSASLFIDSTTSTHVAMTYDGTTITLYKNGAALKSGSASGVIANNAQPLTIGRSNYASSSAMDGRIAGLAIYNDVLSTNRLREHAVAAGY